MIAVTTLDASSSFTDLNADSATTLPSFLITTWYSKSFVSIAVFKVPVVEVAATSPPSVAGANTFLLALNSTVYPASVNFLTVVAVSSPLIENSTVPFTSAVSVIAEL